MTTWLTPKQGLQLAQEKEAIVIMTGKDVGIEIPNLDDPDRVTHLRASSAGFWKRLWRRMFGPRQPPKFYIAVRRPPNTTVEIATIRSVRARDDPKAWTDLMVTFRFMPEKKK